jgi:N6-adenosine-specific RNA methylase IME4
MQYKKHELNLYPELQGNEYQSLKNSIQVRYYKIFPIIIYEDKILDGWNRYRVCIELNIEPEIKQFQGNRQEALEFVINSNERRDLTIGQRACLAMEYQPLIEEEARKRMLATQNNKTGKEIAAMPNLAQQKGSTREIASKKFEVSHTYVDDVKKIKEEAPELYQEIYDGNLNINKAKDQIRIKKENQKKAEKQNTPEMQQTKKYQIIYADPPWKYNKDEAYFGQDVEKHYPVMTYEELKELPIKDLADKDCVLYLWTTAPKLNWGIDLLRDWGFDYKSCLIWDKVKHNMGYYSSVRHEILLIGGRGASAPTDKSYANQTDSVYVEERKEHSTKPNYYYEMIEKMHPLKTKRIELFARNKKERWDSWGHDAK